MFYGLHAFYWDAFKAARQGPVLLRTLKDAGYEVRAMGSAGFRNPEFRQTCFADLSPDEVLDCFKGPPPDRDEAMAAAFGEFLASRDDRRPFFGFLFFDSPHSARYKELPGFRPPLDVAPADYVDYDRLIVSDSERRRTRLRFLNSVAYVDFLVGRVLDDLRSRGLLERTIVMVAGDHGEEFGESGHWGHNSSFDDWQTHTAFILHCPGGRPGRISAMTSHVDCAPTTMALLGARPAPGTWCQGQDMLSGRGRDYVVAASWSEAAVITAEGGRMVFPLEAYRLSTLEVYDRLHRPLADRRAFLSRNGGRLGEVLRSAGTFKH